MPRSSAVSTACPPSPEPEQRLPRSRPASCCVSTERPARSPSCPRRPDRQWRAGIAGPLRDPDMTLPISPYDARLAAARPVMPGAQNRLAHSLSLAWAQRLLEVHGQADRDIVSLAILLHDIGWYSIDMADIIEKGFGPDMMKSDVRFL